MLERARQRPLVLALGTLAAAGALVAIFVWFQPHKLFLDDEVDEALPRSSPVPAEMIGEDQTMDEGMPSGDAPEPDVLASGSFVDRSHPTSGTARVLLLADGSRFLRIEDLDTDNGPDLFVYLSAAAPDAPTDEVEREFVNLGRLKGNIGNQNYEIPGEVDIDALSTVVIWCDRFSVNFGAAALA